MITDRIGLHWVPLPSLIFIGLAGESCQTILHNGYKASGMYFLLRNGANIPVYCDQSTNGGGWTTIQLRQTSHYVSFDRADSDYAYGFGSFVEDWKKEGTACLRRLERRLLGKWEGCCQFPFASKSDLFQISPAASPEILHHTWKTWLFIANSDEIWLYYQLFPPHLFVYHWEVWRMYVLILGVKWLG